MFFFLRSCAPSGGSSTGGPSLKVRVTAEVRVRLVRAWECQTSQSRQSRQARPEEPSSGAAKGTGTLTMLPRGLYCSRRSDAQPLALRTRCLSVARGAYAHVYAYIRSAERSRYRRPPDRGTPWSGESAASRLVRTVASQLNPEQLSCSTRVRQVKQPGAWSGLLAVPVWHHQEAPLSSRCAPAEPRSVPPHPKRGTPMPWPASRVRCCH